jgi:Spy/CpxP family protein refolding chaperone
MHKQVLSMIAAAIFTVLPFYASAQQNQMMEYMHGHGGGMGESMYGICGEQGGMGIGERGVGMMGGRGKAGMLGPLAMLDLNPDQRTRINRIELDLRKQIWALRGKTFDAQAQLQDLYSADRPDPKKIGALYAQIFDVRRQMAEATIDAMNRARDVLNKEQQAKLKAFQQSHQDCREFE